MTPLEELIDRMKQGVEIHKRVCETKSESPMRKHASNMQWGLLNNLINIAENKLEKEKVAFRKASEFDDLDNQIGEIYQEDNSDLLQIGELAATHFGYL